MLNLSDIFVSNTYSDNVTHDHKLRQLAQKSKKAIQIICPFISFPGLDWLSSMNEGVNFEVITELSTRGVISGVQKPACIKKLMEMGASVHYLTGELHAKVYIFDYSEVVVSSANMTNNGLSRNFELGIFLNQAVLNDSFVKDAKNITQYIASYWAFVKKQSEPVSEEALLHYEEIQEKTKAERDRMRELIDQLGAGNVDASYIPIDRACSNPSNIPTELHLTNIFAGFNSEIWDVFDHGRELTPENLASFKSTLDNEIDPILLRFYMQLKHEPAIKSVLNGLNRRTVKNLLLKNEYPGNRYLVITKPEKGVTWNEHIGRPSLIFSIGDYEPYGKHFEIRTGVEEVFKKELTAVGENFIIQLKRNIDEVLSRFADLGPGWYLSHGSYKKGRNSEPPLESLSKDELLKILDHYLTTREVSDMQIIKYYRLSVPSERELLFSPKFSSTVAKEYAQLSWFFELAHKKHTGI
jgi:HKD family nuclease